MKQMKSMVLGLLLLAATGVLGAQIVAQWRGADRKGVYPDRNLLRQWPEGGPILTWVNETIGNGYGSPAVTADRIYVAGEVGGMGWLFALDRKGGLVWKASYGKEWVRSFPGSRSAPTVVGNRVYLVSGSGSAACFDSATGKQVWLVDMVKDFGGRAPLHGFAESPLVEGDAVFVTPGGPEHNVIALNRHTGKLLWTCRGRGEISAYNSPALVNLPGRRLLAVFTAYSLLGIDAKTGKLLWWHEQTNTPPEKRKPGNGDTHANTIWAEKGALYYLAGDGNGAVKLELSADGAKVREVWRNKDIDNYQGGFIKLGPTIYTTATESRELRGLDAASGKTGFTAKWGAGVLISADGRLYYYNQEGTVRLIAPEGATPRVVGTLKVAKGTKEHFAHPVIAWGTLYIRHGQALLAYDLRAPRGGAAAK